MWAWVPKHSVGSELSLQRNTVTGFWAGIPRVLSALKVTQVSLGMSGMGFTPAAWKVLTVKVQA